MKEEEFKEELEKDIDGHRKAVTITSFAALFLVSGLIAFGSWYFLTKLNKDNPEFRSFFRPQKKQVDVEASNLETYKNAGQKISFQYPKDWKIEDRLPKDGTEADANQSILLKSGKDAVNVYINPKAGDFGLSKINVSYDSKVENGKVVLGMRTETKEEGATGYIIMTARMDREGKKYWFVTSGENAGNAGEVEKVFKKVTETFKFE